jgi:hypothetical protein
MQELSRFCGGVCSNPECLIRHWSFLGRMNSVRNNVEQPCGSARDYERTPSTDPQWQKMAANRHLRGPLLNVEGSAVTVT